MGYSPYQLVQGFFHQRYLCTMERRWRGSPNSKFWNVLPPCLPRRHRKPRWDREFFSTWYWIDKLAGMFLMQFGRWKEKFFPVMTLPEAKAKRPLLKRPFQPSSRRCYVSFREGSHRKINALKPAVQFSLKMVWSLWSRHLLVDVVTPEGIWK